MKVPFWHPYTATLSPSISNTQLSPLYQLQQADRTSKPLAAGMIQPLAGGRCRTSAAFSILHLSILLPRTTDPGGMSINADGRMYRKDHQNLACLPQSKALQQDACGKPSKAGFHVVERQQGMNQSLQVMDKLSYSPVVSSLLTGHMQQAKICSHRPLFLTAGGCFCSIVCPPHEEEQKCPFISEVAALRWLLSLLCILSLPTATLGDASGPRNAAYVPCSSTAEDNELKMRGLFKRGNIGRKTSAAF